MSKDGERDYLVNLSVLEELQQGKGGDAGHRQISWEEGQASYNHLPEPERRLQLEHLKRLELTSGLQEG